VKYAGWLAVVALAAAFFVFHEGIYLAGAIVLAFILAIYRRSERP
jgi:hypothetical protein